ncbi:MAG: NAD-dependent epimerase/dehydratase family protein, partial [Chitinophagales bacterium]
MQIGITGASGHVGANLCRTLLANHFKLRATVHETIAGITDLPIEKIKTDITNSEQVENFTSGCDMVIHLAAKISIDGDPKGNVSAINLQGTRNIVNACKKYGVKKLIYFSSIHAHNAFPLHETLDEHRDYVSHHATPYDLSKV